VKRLKVLILGGALAAALAIAGVASAGYVPVTFNGQVYNLCDHLRPGTATYHDVGCDAP